MRKINLFNIYRMAPQLDAIKHVSGEVTLQQALDPIFNASSALKALLEGQCGIDLGLSRPAAVDAQKWAEGLISQHFTFANTPNSDRQIDWNAKIPWYELQHLRFLIEKFEHVLAEELRAAATYFVPRVGIYDTGMLVSAADAHLPIDESVAIPEFCRSEIRAAGVCMAFGLTTAAGFHLMRAVESMLRDYCAVYGVTIPTNATMGACLAELKKPRENSTQMNQKTIREIDKIRELDRNPLMHPDTVLSTFDAQMLFNQVSCAVASMARDVSVLRSEQEQLTALIAHKAA